jgi:RNA polymerase sigma-70 factor (ECF subfamily)
MEIQLEEFTGSEIPLLGRCAHGDRVAWRELHREYHAVAVAFLRRLGVRDSALEDVCQDVFFEVFRHLPSFRGDAQFTTWLYRLCATQARRARRMERQRYKASPDASYSLALMFQDPSTWNEAVVSTRVSLALAQLSDCERETFVLYEFENRSGKQIAEHLRCPEATVWRRLHYARRRFRAAILATERETVETRPPAR